MTMYISKFGWALLGASAILTRCLLVSVETVGKQPASWQGCWVTGLMVQRASPGLLARRLCSIQDKQKRHDLWKSGLRTGTVSPTLCSVGQGHRASRDSGAGQIDLASPWKDFKVTLQVGVDTRRGIIAAIFTNSLLQSTATCHPG